MSASQDTGRHSSTLENASRVVLIGTVALLPILFVPVSVVPFGLTKTAFACLGVLIALGLYLLHLFQEGSLSLPKQPVLLALAALPAAYLVSAFVTGNASISLAGVGLEIDSVAFIAVCALLSALSTFLLTERKWIFNAYLAIFGAFWLAALFHALRLAFGPGFLSFGVLSGATSSLLGSWNDLGIFFALVTVLSLVTLGSLSGTRFSRAVLYGSIAVSLMLLLIVNFSLIWGVLGLVSLAFLTREFIAGKVRRVELLSRPLFNMSVLVFAFSLVGFFGGGLVGAWGASFFDTAQIEARPSWSSTISVARATYANDSLLFGSGPNTFVEQWAKYHPTEVNLTPFWSADFPLAVGFIPTSFITAGLLAGLAWVVFLGLLGYRGFLTLMDPEEDEPIAYYLALSSFVAAAFLWFFVICYATGAVLVLLAFFFTGVFLAASSALRKTKSITLTFAENPRVGFMVVLVLSVALLFSLISVYLLAERYVGGVFFERAAAAVRSGDLDRGISLTLSALRLNENDQYLRAAAQEQVAKLISIVNESSSESAEARQAFQETFARAVEYGLRATRENPDDYRNWVMLGNVYGSIVPLGIEGAYESSLAAYEEARARKPHGPGVILALAELAVGAGKNDEARQFITEALAEKRDYTAAIFLLSRIEVLEGSVEKAIESVEAAAVLDPQNPVVYFQLGFLRYSAGDARGAIEALERAVELNGVYANARYFLGLAYDRVGREEDAIAEFSNIQQTNPGNADISRIIENLEAGRAPLSGVGGVSNSLPIEGE